MKPIKTHSSSLQVPTPSPSAQFEIVTTLFLKHGGVLLDSSKLSDLVLIADVLTSSDAMRELAMCGQGRDLIALIAKLPSHQQQEVLSSPSVVELINCGCGAAILRLTAQWPVAARRAFMGMPRISRAFRERGFGGAINPVIGR